jgi:hypothetical protein
MGDRINTEKIGYIKQGLLPLQVSDKFQILGQVSLP